MIDETTNDNILNNNAKFNIKLNGENIETTTNKDGQIILQGLTIPDINQFDINFTETQTPFGYEQLNEMQTIRAKVTKIYDSRVLHNVEIVEGERIRIVQTSDSEIMVNILYKPTEPSEDPLYLTSDVYRVTDNYVERVSNSTKVKDYLANMKSNGTMTIYDKDGNIVDESKFIGTGMIIETVKGTEKIRKTVSVIGDVTGDGEIKALDISKMKQHLIGKRKLEGAYLLAADITDDGEVKALDISKEKQAIIGKIIL